MKQKTQKKPKTKTPPKTKQSSKQTTTPKPPQSEVKGGKCKGRLFPLPLLLQQKPQVLENICMSSYTVLKSLV